MMTSATPARVDWQLSYSGLSAAEWNALQTLFRAVQGRFQPFTFVDPTDNLLSWSEDLTAAAWIADPLLQISPGAADPFGRTSATLLMNGAQAPQQLTQGLAGPSWFEYCFCVYLRADGPCTVDLIRASAGQEARNTVAVSENWSRFSTSGALEGQDDSVRFGVELGPGTSVYAFGPQAEAQPCAGAYKPKLDRSGIYTKSRFDQDALVQTSETLGQYSTTIQITSTY